MKLTDTMEGTLRTLARYGTLDAAHNTAAGLYRRGYLRSPSRFLGFRSLTPAGLAHIANQYADELARCSRMKGGLSGIRARQATEILRKGWAWREAS